MVRNAFILLVALCATMLFAGEAGIEYFTARSDGSTVNVEWKASYESGVQNYEIERASSEQSFRKVSNLEPRGSGSVYRYADNEAFFRGGDNQRIDVKATYQYRIRIIYRDNTSSYSNTVNVAHNVSSIKRTWGMIKEMFR